MSKFKYIFLCLLLVATVLFIFGIKGADSEKITVSQKELFVPAAAADSSIFCCNSKIETMKKISSSGVLEMYLDEKTLSVCILDTISGKLWRSLPASSEDKDAANLKAVIIIKGREYTLNSQSDSLYLECAFYETADSGTLTLFYSFRKSLENGKKIDLTIPVELKLTDGTLSVKVNCSNIEDKSNVKIYLKSLEILPFFGADSQAESGDYILLPSGSGIIMDTYKKSDDVPEIYLPVYGEDTGKNLPVTSFVPIGAFGIKSSDSAFICLIDEGAASAAVKAKKAGETSDCNRAGAEFEITPMILQGSSLYLSRNPYKGIISLSYRFLNGNNANYITMAGACRELLIRQGVLTDSNLSSQSYPFNLSLIGSTAENGITSTDEQAKELLSSLLAKGISNINIMLKDTESRNISLLSDFSLKNGLSLTVAQSLFTFSEKGDLTLSGDKNSSGLSTSKTEKSAENIINLMRKTSSGVLLTDCGNILPGSYGKSNNSSRHEMLTTVSELCTTLSSHGSLILSGANIYTLKYADGVINIPESSPLEEYDCCSAVPFLEAVLHGICDYSFTAVNLSTDPVNAMLKAIEYGALPHYEWYFGQYEENDPLYYMNSLSQARLLYENMKKIFSDLRDQRITAHERIGENLTRTVYSSGSEIYVNYSDKAVTSGGITVDPMSFVRVN